MWRRVKEGLWPDRPKPKGDEGSFGPLGISQGKCPGGFKIYGLYRAWDSREEGKKTRAIGEDASAIREDARL
jgi:hypothetical protein